MEGFGQVRGVQWGELSLPPSGVHATKQQFKRLKRRFSMRAPLGWMSSHTRRARRCACWRAAPAVCCVLSLEPSRAGYPLVSCKSLLHAHRSWQFQADAAVSPRLTCAPCRSMRITHCRQAAVRNARAPPLAPLTPNRTGTHLCPLQVEAHHAQPPRRRDLAHCRQAAAVPKRARRAAGGPAAGVTWWL